MDFNNFDPNDCSLLIGATKTLNITLVQESINKLVELGKDITHELHTADRQGFTAIHHAAQLQLVDILNLLLEYADYRAVNQLSFDNRSALTVSVDGVTPNTEGEILRALLEKGANPNLPEKDPFILPLLSVLANKQWKCVQVLLQFGADPMKCDGCHTVLPIYFALADLETLKLLVSKCYLANFSERISLNHYLKNSQQYPITTDQIDVHEVVKIIIEQEQKIPNHCGNYYQLAVTTISLSLPAFRYLLSQTTPDAKKFIYTILSTGRLCASRMFEEELGKHLLRFLPNKSEFFEAASYFFATFEGSVEEMEKHLRNVEEAGGDLKELKIDLSPWIKTSERRYNLVSARLYMVGLTDTTLYLCRKLMAVGVRVSSSAYHEANRTFMRIRKPSQTQIDFMTEIFMSFVKDQDMRSEDLCKLAAKMFVRNSPCIKSLLQHGVPIDRHFFTTIQQNAKARGGNKFDKGTLVENHMKLFMERFVMERPPSSYDMSSLTFANPTQTNSTVWSLKHHCRISIRNSFDGVNIYDKIDSLAQLVPPEVISYLKFDREELDTQ